MPSAMLKFNLPEDQSAHLAAIHGLDWALVCLAIHREIRAWLKYGHSFNTPGEVLEAVDGLLHDEMSDRNISLEMIE